MVQQTAPKRRILRGLLAVFLSLGLLCLGGWVLLFRVNSFALEVTLNGDGEMTITPGDVFNDPGANARLVGSLFFRDGIDLNVTPDSFGQVDSAVPGTYEISYKASFWEWEGTGKRIVHVADVEAPEITLISVPGSFTVHGEPYAEEGFSAWDAVDGDITDRVTREERDGFVIYSVADRAGNVASVGRKIFYVDITPPELVLLGGQEIFIPSGQGFTEPGWTALDNIDGDLGDRVKVEGFVDKYLAGSYQLCYTVKDNSGNISEVYRTVQVQAKPLPEKVNPSGRVIYLTFDDGPGPYTQWLLDILEAYDAKATFFVVDTGYSEELKRIVEDGHSIGIHSVSHTYREIYASADAYFADILTMQKIIYDQTGVQTWLMRFPGGSSNTVSRFNEGIMTYLTQAVEDMGFQYFDWNVDSMDAGGAKDAEEVFDNVTAGAQNRRISIVLQHDIKDFSVEAVEMILRWGRANGYTFLGLDMTSPTAHHGVNN